MIDSLRLSCKPRIQLFTLATTFFGVNAGYVVTYQHLFKNVVRETPTAYTQQATIMLRQSTLGYAKFSLGVSFMFFALNEALTLYFDQTNIYHNYWTTSTLSGYITFTCMHQLARSRSRLRPESAVGLVFANSDLRGIRKRCHKFAMMLIVFNLAAELILQFKRRLFLLKNCYNEDIEYLNLMPKDEKVLQIFIDNDGVYNLLS